GLAQALLGNPSLLILDEPMVGLDPAQIIEMRQLIRSLRKEHTVILSSHILSEIESVCDHIIILDQGKVVAEDATRQLSEENSNQKQLRLVVKGEKKEIHRILRETELLKRFSLVNEVERGVYEFQVVSAKEQDIRDDLFLLFAQNQMIVYSINVEQLSLEEVFIKLTGKEEKK
ncbi:MAG: ABC transporter, partial [Lachnospiraceae bacterium]|nr:ABC transporter [Lachnospiraceae bacterium]